MTVRLIRPYGGQAVNTLYTGADEAVLKATGNADDRVEEAFDYANFNRARQGARLVAGGLPYALQTSGLTAGIGSRNTATRCASASAKYTLSSANAQTGHFHRGEATTTIQVEYANWYSDSAVQEAGTGNSATFSAGFFHPVSGQWHAFRWGGGLTQTAPDGGTTGLSDPLSIPPLLDGARFLMRVHVETVTNSLAVHLLANSGGSQIGDVFEASGTPGALADKTTNGATINQNNGATPNIRPLRIVTTSARRSLYIIGNSRDQGQGSTPPATGDVGDIAPSFGPYMGYQGNATVGATLTGLIANGTRRLAGLLYATDVTLLDAINDISAGRTAAQIMADYTTLIGLVKAVNPAVNVWVKTTSPKVTTTDGITQTVDAADAVRQEVNNRIRAGQLVGATGIIDVASVDEDYASLGKYETPNGKAIIGTDGLHKTQYGYEYQRRGGAADPRKLFLRF